VTLERDILAASGGGCRAPIGASATAAPGGRVEVVAGFARPDGSMAFITSQSASQASRASLASLVESVLGALAERAAEAALARGWPRVLVTRAAEQAPALSLALVDRGLAPVAVPAIAIEPIPDALADPVRRWASYDWVVMTSANAVVAVLDGFASNGPDKHWSGNEGGPRRAAADPGRAAAGPRWAAVGRATTRALLGAGIEVAFQPTRASGRALAEELPIEPGQRVLAPRSDAADDGLVEMLERRGATVEPVVAYRTIEAPPPSRSRLEAALTSRVAAVVFTSGSTVRGLLDLADALDSRTEVLRIPAICIGEPTAAEARRLGFDVVATSARQAVGAIADVAAGYLPAQEVAP